MIFLASSSPRRAALLTEAGLAHQTISTIDDGADAGDGVPQAIAIERARAKALGADWQAHSEQLAAGQSAILAADTVVSLAGKALGSPTNADEARAMLQQLSGTRHSVITAHCCYLPAINDAPAKEAVALSMAHITMMPLMPDQIEAYVAGGEGIGKAGGYAIQGDADPFIADVEGERDTVIGLQVAAVRRLFRQVTGHQPEELA